MDMPKPTAAHQALRIMTGVWVGEEKMYPAHWMPEGGGVAEARVENRLALGGLVVIQEYAQFKEGQRTFEGHAVLGWDADAGQYVMHWFDSMGGEVNVFRGTLQEGQLVLTAHGPQGQMQGAWDFGAGDACTFRMSVSPDGNQWQAVIEGSYRRAPL